MGIPEIVQAKFYAMVIIDAVELLDIFIAIMAEVLKSALGGEVCGGT